MLRRWVQEAGGGMEAPAGAASALDVALECAPGCTFPQTLGDLCPAGEGLEGYPRPECRGGGADKCRRKRRAPTEAPRFSQTGSSAAARTAGAPQGVWREGGDAKTREEKGRSPHRRARRRSCPHSTAAPGTATRRAASSHRRRSYILFLLYFSGR